MVELGGWEESVDDCADMMERSALFIYVMNL